MNKNPINLAVYKELQDTTGLEFACELVDTFLEEAPGMLSALRCASADSNAVQFRQAAHSLKSNADIFGAAELAAQARALELKGLDPDTVRNETTLVALEAMYACASTALQALRND
jgi:HPt (histidine-containing phosphotransfer) domain-containing protein